MLDRLIPLLGYNIQSEEIKAIYKEWNALYPKKPYCSNEEPVLKTKVEKDCIRLYFGKGGGSQHLKPIHTSWEGGYVAQLYTIEFTKKSRGGIPLGITHAMSDADVTAKMGQPIIEGTKTTWQKNTSDLHQLTVTQFEASDGAIDRTIRLSFAAD
jgi:hypothetical protein